jgi:hypothetical protein
MSDGRRGGLSRHGGKRGPVLFFLRLEDVVS